ncbi:MAG: hypothetical protein KKB50_17035, partial [Planctomycetes bacterium]|nr:hypothetical protein [Planctomycetota bacterium]
PACHALIAAGYANCPECGHEFPERQRSKHEATAGTEAILSDQVTRTEYDVAEVFYAIHEKRGAPPDAPRTLRVDYKIGFQTYVSEWVCLEHSGFARHKAEQWWQARSNEPVPYTAEEAVELAEAGALAPTLAVTVERGNGDRFDRVVVYQLGERPPRLESSENVPEYAYTADDEIPF